MKTFFATILAFSMLLGVAESHGWEKAAEEVLQKTLVIDSQGTVNAPHHPPEVINGGCTAWVWHQARALAVTAAHCVRNHGFIHFDSVSITVEGTKYEVEVLSVSDLLDIAVLKSDAFRFFPAISRDSRTKIGEEVLAVGFSGGLGAVVKSGIISTYIEPGKIVTDFIFRDGMSGGLLVDRQGDVVALITASDPKGGVGLATGVAAIEDFLKEEVL